MFHDKQCDIDDVVILVLEENGYYVIAMQAPKGKEVPHIIPKTGWDDTESIDRMPKNELKFFLLKETFNKQESFGIMRQVHGEELAARMMQELDDYREHKTVLAFKKK